MIYKKHILTNKIIKADKEVVFQNNENEYTTPTQEEIESLEFETLQTDCINAIEAEKKYLLENGLVQITTEAGVVWRVKIDTETTNELDMVEAILDKIQQKYSTFLNWLDWGEVLITTKDIIAIGKEVAKYKINQDIATNIYSIARKLKTEVYACKTLAELQAYNIDTEINALRDLREELFLNEASASSIHIPEQPDAGTGRNLDTTGSSTS